MASKMLEAFVKLFLDADTFKSQVGRITVEAERAGTRISEAFSNATRERPGGAGGGGLGDLASGPLGQAGRVLGGGRGVAALGRLANPWTAAIAAAGVALTAYTRTVRDASDAELDLAAARASGDPAKVQAIIEKQTAAMDDYVKAARQALTPVEDLASGVQAAIGQFRLAREELFGKGLQQMQKEAEAAKKAATELWQAWGRPQLAVEALKRASAELATAGDLSKAAARDSLAYSAAVDLLVASKDRQAAADVKVIELEKAQLLLNRSQGKITEAEFTDKLADANARLGAVRTKLAADLTVIERDRARQLAEMSALEIEHTEKIAATVRQRRDAIVTALGQILEVEAATTLSLEQAFRARAALQATETRNALAALKEETDARRAALQERLQGAIGQERVNLERELTQVTEEETTKRTTIQAQAVAKGVQLADQERQARLQRATELFRIQNTLGMQAADAEVKRWAEVARAAENSSQKQIEALGRVAEAQKELQGKGQSVVDQAVAASDRRAAELGITGPRLISKSEVEAAVREQDRRGAAAKSAFESGRPILRSDFDLIKPAQQLKEAAGQFGSDFTTSFSEAFKAASTPVKEAFDASIGSALAASFGKMAEDASKAFASLATGLADSLAGGTSAFRDFATSGTQAITELATGATGALGTMESALDGIFSRLLGKIRDGSEEAITAIADAVENKLVRRMQQAAKAQ